MYKQILIFREDLLTSITVPRGKIASQIAHASMQFLINEPNVFLKEDVQNWIKTGMTKIVCVCNDLKHLEKLDNEAYALNLRSYYVIDEGRTVFNNELTKTVLAIGPNLNENVDKITRSLKLLK